MFVVIFYNEFHQKIKTIDNLEFFTVSVDSKKEIPFMDTMVSAGFPSPADDYLDLPIDLNEYLVETALQHFISESLVILCKMKELMMETCWLLIDQKP